MKKLNEHLTGRVEGDHLGARMLASRTHAGLARKDAAKRIGISLSQLGRIERGSVGMVDNPMTIRNAAAIYGVSDVWLYAGAMAGAKFVPNWYGAPKLELAA